MPVEFLPPLVIFLAIIGWTLWDVTEEYTKSKKTKGKKSDGLRSWTGKIQTENNTKQEETNS